MDFVGGTMAPLWFEITVQKRKLNTEKSSNRKPSAILFYYKAGVPFVKFTSMLWQCCKIAREHEALTIEQED